MDQLARVAGMAYGIISDHRYSGLIAPFLWLADAVLCLLIVNRVQYTEIDWRAYMEQVYLILSGERDYAKIQGGTGPLVYPAGHVGIFTMLYDWTEGGTDIAAAQHVFVMVYLLTLAIVLWLYVKARIPPGYLPLAILSKRLHSIYMLRMFNDCFTTLFAVSAIAILCARKFSPIVRCTIATVLFSMAVSVKMSALLYLPGAAVVMLGLIGSVPGCIAALLIPFATPQIILALPFVKDFPQSYLNKAFEFSRVFLFKWTVNWRFVGENVFLSPLFSIALVIIHLLVLGAFVYAPGRRWLKPFRETTLAQLAKNLFSLQGIQTPHRIKNYSRYVITTVALSNLIGVLCARSLHYQFYCWFYWSVPLLLATSSMPWYVSIGVWAMQEYAWNVYPSTEMSSAFTVLALALTVVNNWAVNDAPAQPTSPVNKKED